MSSWGELYEEESRFLEDRLEENWYDERDNPGSFLGAAVGYDRLPSAVSKPLNRAFNDYVVAPLAASIRRFGQGDTTRAPKRSKRESGDNIGALEPPAITTSGGFKTYDMSTRKNSRNKRKQRLQGQAPKPAQAPLVPPGTRRKNASGKWMVMGNDRKWHIARIRVESSDGSTNVNHYNWRTNTYDWYETNNGKRPRNMPKAPKKRTNLAGAFRALKIKQQMDSSGLQISGASFSGDNYTQTKRIRFQGDDDNVMHVKLYLGIIGYTTAGKVTWSPNATGGTDTGGQYYFNPTIQAYIPAISGGALIQTALRYRRFRILGGNMTFSPLISGYSNPDIRVAAMITPDIDEFAAISNSPSRFVGAPATPTAQDTLTREVIVGNPRSCATPGWTEKGFSCPLPTSRRWYNCTSPDSTSVASNVVDFTSSWTSYKTTLAFVFGINISGTVGGATLNILEGTMDLKIQFAGQAAGGSAALPMISMTNTERKLALILDKLRAMDPSDDKEDVKRAVSPAPSQKDSDSQPWVSLRSQQIVDDLDRGSVFRSPINVLKSSSNKSNK